MLVVDHETQSNSFDLKFSHRWAQFTFSDPPPTGVMEGTYLPIPKNGPLYNKMFFIHSQGKLWPNVLKPDRKLDAVRYNDAYRDANVVPFTLLKINMTSKHETHETIIKYC